MVLYPLLLAANAIRETWFLSVSLLLIALVFVARLVQERRGRGELGSEEAEYYGRKDRRRGAVAAVLVVISGLLGFSTRIDVKERVGARLWAWTMMAVLVLAMVLLVLALLDWRANHLHALRQGRALVEEHRALLAETFRAYQRERSDEEGSGGESRGSA